MSAIRDGAPDQPDGWTPGDLLDRDGAPVSRGGRWRELLRESLPLGLRDGRIDLGARAAAALSMLALVAAAVALLLAWRSAARPVAAPSAPAAAGAKIAIPAPAGESGAVPASGPASASTPNPAAVLVEVAGKVRRPGVVKVPAGARVNDAIAAAGGLVPGTTTDGLALARRLVDGEQIVVGLPPPTAGPSAPSPGPPVAGSPAAGGDGQPVDLNAATAADLDGLPGIGPVLAERVIAWREEHGGFTSVEQLREVSGLGDKKYEALAELVRV